MKGICKNEYGFNKEIALNMNISAPPNWPILYKIYDKMATTLAWISAPIFGFNKNKINDSAPNKYSKWSGIFLSLNTSKYEKTIKLSAINISFSI